MTFGCELAMSEREALRRGPTRSSAMDSVRRRTQRAGLPSKIDVQANDQKLTGTHAAIVRDNMDKVNL